MFLNDPWSKKIIFYFLNPRAHNVPYVILGGPYCPKKENFHGPLMFLMCFFNTFAIVCYYFVILCWHSHLFVFFVFFWVVLGVVQVCFCNQPSLGHS